MNTKEHCGALPLPKSVLDAFEVKRCYNEMAIPLGPQPRFTEEEESAIKDALRKAYRAGERLFETEAWQSQDDKPLPEDDAIHEAFPTRSDRHDLYVEAMRLVGAKYTKGALVALVNWLLHRIERNEEAVSRNGWDAAIDRALEEVEGVDPDEGTISLYRRISALRLAPEPNSTDGNG